MSRVSTFGLGGGGFRTLAPEYRFRFKVRDSAVREEPRSPFETPRRLEGTFMAGYATGLKLSLGLWVVIGIAAYLI